jgi:serine phosphatase RsbU (regulator of sigma subunit)
VAKKLGKTSKGIYGPGAVLDSVNKELLSLELEDQHVVALLVAILNLQTGELQVARAGLPMPIYLPASGEPETWMIAGPFLGTADASYSFRKAMLRAGDRLVMATDGTRPEANPAPGGDQKLLELSLRHRKHWGQGYVDALAGDLLAEVRHSDDFTLLCLELAKE